MKVASSIAIDHTPGRLLRLFPPPSAAFYRVWEQQQQRWQVHYEYNEQNSYADCWLGREKCSTPAPTATPTEQQKKVFQLKSARILCLSLSLGDRERAAEIKRRAKKPFYPELSMINWKGHLSKSSSRGSSITKCKYLVCCLQPFCNRLFS